MSNTIANIRPSEGGHWYYTDGKPCYEVEKADGKGMTPTTLRHARKLNLIPSVTTILRILDKPALTAWKIEQAVLAVVTTPKLAGESDDAFVERVLKTDKEQDKERDVAAKLGSDIHGAIEDALNDKPYPDALRDYVEPALVTLRGFGQVKATEEVVVGRGYAGRIDARFESETGITILDFKTTKRLPKESYPEHKLQLAAYAKGILQTSKPVSTANIYISTVEAGKVAVCGNSDIESAYAAFEHLVALWQWANSYTPKQ